jgi:hypothetical protein
MVKIETNVLANIYTVIKWASNRKVHTEQIKKDLHQVKLPFCVALQTMGLADAPRRVFPLRWYAYGRMGDF